MTYKRIFVYSVGVLIVGIGLYNSKFINSRIKSDGSVSTQKEQATLQMQSVTIGDVEYFITPKNIISSSKTWDFEIILDTHTGSLNQDLATLINIADNKGNEYQATKWVGDPPGGHHRKGILEFIPITPYPSSIDLKIQTTTTAQDIILNWNL